MKKLSIFVSSVIIGVMTFSSNHESHEMEMPRMKPVINVEELEKMEAYMDTARFEAPVEVTFTNLGEK